MELKQKLRIHYTGVTILILAMVAVFYLVSVSKPGMDKAQAEILKSVVYLLNLVGIPLSFGWFGILKKSKITNPWKFRFWFLLSLNMVNCGIYYLAAERSLFFILLISAGMFLLNKPMEEPKPIEEEEDEA